MSDFFARLIGRSVGSEDVVQPRPISIFEPPRTGVTSVAEATASHDAIEPSRLLDVGLEREPASVDPSPADVRAERRHDPQTPAMERRARVTVPGAETLPIGRDSEAPPHSTVDGSARVESVRQQTNLARGLAISAETRVLDPVPTDAGSPSIDRTQRTSLPIEPIDVHQTPARRHTVRASADPPVVTRAGDRSHRTPANAVLPAEPTVHVTIGRVEIRAITPDTPKRKDGGGSPVMGLDEYLRTQRTGAGR